VSLGGAAGYRASRGLLTPQRLREFFAPRSIALVGASNNSGWAGFIVASCAAAGVTVDATFGPVLAVGLGGIWVEILHDTSLRVLPVDAAEVRRMPGELRGLPLLQGARGTRPADLDAVAEAIAGLGRTALSLDGALRALEVNPLWVNGDQVEALDVLVVTGARPEGEI
jgi:hypothetical protein